MKRIVLPGFGTPVTFTPREDSAITVRAAGKFITLQLKANTSTRIEFVNSMTDAVAA